MMRLRTLRRPGSIIPRSTLVFRSRSVPSSIDLPSSSFWPRDVNNELSPSLPTPFA